MRNATIGLAALLLVILQACDFGSDWYTGPSGGGGGGGGGGGSPTLPADIPLRISGMVTSAADGSTVVAAVVEVRFSQIGPVARSLTDADGSYRIAQVIPCREGLDLDLTVAHPAYEEYEEGDDDCLCTSEHQVINITLNPGS